MREALLAERRIDGDDGEPLRERALRREEPFACRLGVDDHAVVGRERRERHHSRADRVHLRVKVGVRHPLVLGRELELLDLLAVVLHPVALHDAPLACRFHRAALGARALHDLVAGSDAWQRRLVRPDRVAVPQHALLVEDAIRKRRLREAGLRAKHPEHDEREQHRRGRHDDGIHFGGNEREAEHGAASRARTKGWTCVNTMCKRAALRRGKGKGHLDMGM